MNTKIFLALALVWLLSFDGQAASPSVARTIPAFPLKLNADQRYLVDQNNRPFLAIGDSPWSIIVEPTPAQADLYLDDRVAKGFNVILVNLLEHKFTTQAPNRREGTPPFTIKGDFATPNDVYFRYAEEIVDKAAQRGIAVLLCPAYLGYEGKDEGFYQEMLRCGPDKVRAYGRYIGKRFRNHPNIIWVGGGDFTPPPENGWTVEQVTAGIWDEDKVHMTTVHCGGYNSSASLYGGLPWFQLNNVYDDRVDLYAACLKQDARVPRWPYFLIETWYEGEHKTTPDRIRRQAYWPLLCGAFGVDYGNSPLWHFGSIGVYDKGGDWVAAMNSRGAQDMAHLAALFRDRPWWLLRPDPKVIISGAGEFGKPDYVVAARTIDSTLAIAYLPSNGTGSRVLNVDMRLMVPPVNAHWYNPTDGQLTPIPGSPFPNSEGQNLKSPGDNGTGYNDWVLILETASGHRANK